MNHFRNHGFPHFDIIVDMMPSHSKGTYIFCPGGKQPNLPPSTSSTQPQPLDTTVTDKAHQTPMTSSGVSSNNPSPMSGLSCIPHAGTFQLPIINASAPPSAPSSFLSPSEHDSGSLSVSTSISWGSARPVPSLVVNQLQVLQFQKHPGSAIITNPQLLSQCRGRIQRQWSICCALLMGFHRVWQVKQSPQTMMFSGKQPWLSRPILWIIQWMTTWCSACVLQLLKTNKQLFFHDARRGPPEELLGQVSWDDQCREGPTVVTLVCLICLLICLYLFSSFCTMFLLLA